MDVDKQQQKVGDKEGERQPPQGEVGAAPAVQQALEEAAEEDFLAECGGRDGQATDDGDDRSGDVRVIERRGGDERLRRPAESQRQHTNADAGTQPPPPRPEQTGHPDGAGGEAVDEQSQQGGDAPDHQH